MQASCEIVCLTSLAVAIRQVPHILLAPSTNTLLGETLVLFQSASCWRVPLLGFFDLPTSEELAKLAVVLVEV